MAFQYLVIFLFLTISCIRTVNYTLPEAPIADPTNLEPARLDILCSESGVQYVATRNGLALDFDKNGEFIFCDKNAEKFKEPEGEMHHESH